MVCLKRSNTLTLQVEKGQLFWVFFFSFNSVIFLLTNKQINKKQQSQEILEFFFKHFMSEKKRKKRSFYDMENIIKTQHGHRHEIKMLHHCIVNLIHQVSWLQVSYRRGEEEEKKLIKSIIALLSANVSNILFFFFSFVVALVQFHFKCLELISFFVR